jgi:hypothetical protein
LNQRTFESIKLTFKFIIMKTNLLKSVCVLFLVLVAVSGCKKDDETPSNSYQAPSLATNIKVVEVPSKLSSSSDAHAQIAAGYMNMANAFSAYTAYFTVPSNAVQSKTKSSGTVYSWSYGGVTVKLTYNDDGINRNWAWYLNDIKYLDCQESILGKSGSFNVYDIEHPTIGAVLVYNWSQTATNVTATMKMIGSDSYFFKIVSALDGKSGTFDMYEGTSEAGLHFVNVTWLANGSGSWWMIYGEANYSGSWTN